MNARDKQSENYIFYLQSGSRPDQLYFSLAELLSKISITLIPVQNEDLPNLSKNKKIHLIVARNDLKSAINFKNLRQKYLDTAMASRRFMIYDMSSFSEIGNATSLYSKKTYSYFALPFNLKHVCATIAVSYYSDRNENITRADAHKTKLPSLNN